VSYESILKKIVETGIKEEDAVKKILDKQRELSNLVSKEGAAYIVAKELGVNLIDKTEHRIEIKNIIPGIRNLTLIATVSKINPVRIFERDGREGKVVNVFLADKTGEVRMSLWDEQIDLIKNIKENTVVEVTGAYTREDKVNGVEIRLGAGGKIKPRDEKPVKFEGINEESIANLEEGKKYNIRAAVVQLFEPVVYNICPKCGKSIKENKCNNHGEVEPKKAAVVSCIIDDGYGNMRAVLFRELAEKFTGADTKEIKEQEIYREKLVGNEFIFTGYVRKNQMFGRKEFIVEKFTEADPVLESKKMIELLEGCNL